ncbi:MAG: PD40 domain-containing protein [Gemmatimonadota bacterium]|nr:PD40 domain-containing protein [Gemmatimonadota bacterium]
MRRTIGWLVGAALTATSLAAQGAPPSTDIYLVRLRAGATIGDPPENVTHRPGYDNQPAFTPDGKAILFTSIRADAQADVYRLDLATRAIARLTDTPESEYSPTPLPTGSGFSVVRVERDSAQRLWAFNAQGGAPVLLLPGIAPVGYHVWLDDHTLALFVLGHPNALEIADTRTGEGHAIAHDIGQSLQRVPGGNRFSFLQRDHGVWFLDTADPSAPDGDIQRVIAMPAGAGYVVWISPTMALTATGTELLRLDRAAGAGARWTPIADFREEGLRNLSRLAVSPDGNWLAVVAEPARP